MAKLANPISNPPASEGVARQSLSACSPSPADSVAGWRVSERFSARERAALAWTESLTHVDTTHASDDDFEPLRAHFSEVEISDLTFAIALMSAFNRLAIGMRQ